MFGMLPFERSDDNLFDTFDNFTRNFFRGSNASLPAFRTGIDEGSITAAYNNGILELNLPKAVPVVPESRRIAID